RLTQVGRIVPLAGHPRPGARVGTGACRLDANAQAPKGPVAASPPTAGSRRQEAMRRCLGCRTGIVVPLVALAVGRSPADGRGLQVVDVRFARALRPFPESDRKAT